MVEAVPSVRNRPLSAQDWTTRALDLLMDEGVGAVKISRVCSDFGVTKGSFYWHFDDLDSLKESIAEKWCADCRRVLGEMSELTTRPPLERLRAMAELLVADRSWAVQRVLREWARTDGQVAAMIAEGDAFIVEVIRRSLVELGIPPRQARLRAGIVVYAGIGFAHGQSELFDPDLGGFDDLIEFLAEGAEPGTGPDQPPAT